MRIVRILELPHTLGGTRPTFQIPHLDTAVIRRTNKAHRSRIKRQRADELLMARESLDALPRRRRPDLDLLIVRAGDDQVTSELDTR